MSRILSKSWSLYLLAFLTAKGTAFLGPLGIAYIADAETYGALELAFGYGLLLGPLLTFGVVVAAPQHMLMEGDGAVIDRMAIAALGTVQIAVIFMLALWLGWLDRWIENTTTATLVGIMIAPSAVQLALSTYCRSRGWKSWAAWLDNTATHLLWVTSAILVLTVSVIDIGQFSKIYLWVNGVIAALCILIIWQYWTPPVFARYKKSIQIGFPMMLNGVSIFFVTGSSRILVGTFLGPEELAAYAYIFRIVGTILLIHQFLMTGWAVQIYQDSDENIDRRIMWFCVTISLAGIAIFLLLLFPPVQRLFPKFVNAQDTTLIGLTVCQVILWSLGAGLEPRINRIKRAGIMAIITGSIAAIMVLTIAILFWNNALNVHIVVAVICLAQAVMVGAQLLIIKNPHSKGLPLTRRAIFVGPVVLICLTALFEVLL